MPQQERPDEETARQHVEVALGVALTFADLTGGVDYRFAREGQRCALEVVRLTKREIKEGMLAWADGNQMYTAPRLQHSWWVTTEGYPRYKNLAPKLESALGCLERHNIHEYLAATMDYWMCQVPTMEGALATLRKARVEQAREIPTKLPGSQIHLSPSGSWMSDGPDGAVAELEAFLVATADVRLKLEQSGAAERHIWIWTDSETAGRIRRPIEAYDELPSRPPVLPTEITHLWVAHEPSDRGWRWCPATGWAWIETAAAP